MRFQPVHSNLTRANAQQLVFIVVCAHVYSVNRLYTPLLGSFNECRGSCATIRMKNSEIAVVVIYTVVYAQSTLDYTRLLSFVFGRERVIALCVYIIAQRRVLPLALCV